MNMDKLLADVFENFRNKSVEVCELDPGHFLSAPGLAWQTCLYVDILLMVKKGMRGICHAIHRCTKANNKYLKNYNRNKEPSYIQYLDEHNLYGLAMSQKLAVDSFEWVKDISSINKKLKKFIKLIKNHDQNSDEVYIFEVDIEYLKYLHGLHNDLAFLTKRMKIKNVIFMYSSNVCNLYDKTTMLFI